MGRRYLVSGKWVCIVVCRLGWGGVVVCRFPIYVSIHHRLACHSHMSEKMPGGRNRLLAHISAVRSISTIVIPPWSLWCQDTSTTFCRLVKDRLVAEIWRFRTPDFHTHAHLDRHLSPNWCVMEVETLWEKALRSREWPCKISWSGFMGKSCLSKRLFVSGDLYCVKTFKQVRFGTNPKNHFPGVLRTCKLPKKLTGYRSVESHPHRSTSMLMRDDVTIRKMKKLSQVRAIKLWRWVKFGASKRQNDNVVPTFMSKIFLACADEFWIIRSELACFGKHVISRPVGILFICWEVHYEWEGIW